MDYREEYLKEKLTRLKMESELLVARHEKLLNQHAATKIELEKYINERDATIDSDTAKTPKRKR